MSPSIHDLESPRYDRIARWGWIAERVGYAGMAIFLALAAAGVFGSGPWASATLTLPDQGLEITYPRFAMRENGSTLVVRWQSGGELPATLWLQDTFLEQMGVQRIVPAPIQTVQKAHGILCRFATDAQRPAVALVHLQPQNIGSFTFHIGADHNHTETISTTVYP